MASIVRSLVLTAASALGGCTLLGAGIGAATDSTPRRLSEGLPAGLESGVDVRVHVAGQERPVEGEYVGPVGHPSHALAVARPDGSVVVVPLRRTREVEEVPTPGATTGAFVGLAIDVAIGVGAVVAFAIGMASIDFDGAWRDEPGPHSP
jgi:hypothetical protein